MPYSHYNNSIDVNLYAPESQIPFLFKDTVVEAPNLQINNDATPSLFFKCYSDDIYEAILEDLRSHYIAISNQDLNDADSAESPLEDNQSNYLNFTNEGMAYQQN